MKGKEKCKLLKEVRKEFADANGIPYEPRECNYEGDCLGTCPACEKETEDLLALVKQKEDNGEDIKTVDLEKKCQQLEAERLEADLELYSDVKGDVEPTYYNEFQAKEAKRIKKEISSHTTMGILFDPEDEPNRR